MFVWMCAGHAISVVGFALVSQRVLQASGDRVSAAEAWLWVLTGGLAIRFLAGRARLRFAFGQSLSSGDDFLLFWSAY